VIRDAKAAWLHAASRKIRGLALQRWQRFEARSSQEKFG
jgi:hypothetical protein